MAIIGQSTFAAEVFKLLQKDGHEVVGVFTVLDKGNREDPLGMLLYLLPTHPLTHWLGRKHMCTCGTHMSQLINIVIEMY